MRKEYDDEDEIPERRHSSGKKKKKFGWVNVLTILLVVVLVVLVGVYAVINHYYSKSNYVSDDKITINKSTEVETESTGLTDEETDALQSEILNETQDIELPNNNNVYNILLIGVDRRDKTWYGNSDSMILMSINKDTKQIHMTSFMRDLYANIPDVGVKKLNAACAYGGGPRPRSQSCRAGPQKSRPHRRLRRRSRPAKTQPRPAGRGLRGSPRYS